MHTPAGDIVIEAGDAFFARKDSYMYSEFIATDDRFQSLMFFIEDSFFTDFLKSHEQLLEKKTKDKKTDDSIFRIKISPLFKSSLDSIFPYFLHETSCSKELLKLKFSEIFLHILDSDEHGHLLSFLRNIYSDRRRDLMLLMEENFTKPLTVEEFAKLSGRSLTNFKQEFQKIYNQSPKRWVTRKRLDRAYSLLSTAEKNVSEICFEVGYENFSYFTQLFKQNFGITPKRLQKDQNQQK
jgi:AraC-like DNA-binding protein